MQWTIDWMNEWKTNASPKPGIIVLSSCGDESSRNTGALVLTLVGKGCKMTPSSCRPVSARWGYCLAVEPVSYMDMARPPRGGCLPKGPCRCCCPLGVCHRSEVFSVCREFSCGEQNIFQFNSSCGLISSRAQPDINNGAEIQLSLQETSNSSVESSSPPMLCFWFAFKVFLTTKSFVSLTNKVLALCVDSNTWSTTPTNCCRSSCPYLHEQHSFMGNLTF